MTETARRLFEAAPYLAPVPAGLPVDDDAAEAIAAVGQEVSDRIEEYARGIAKDQGYAMVHPPHVALAIELDTARHRRAALRASLLQTLAVVLFGAGAASVPFLVFNPSSTPLQILFATLFTIASGVAAGFALGRDSAV